MPLVLKRGDEDDDIQSVVDAIDIHAIAPLQGTGAVPPDLRGKDLLFYDGVCRFCNGITQLAGRHDPTDRWRFVALQSELATTALARHGIDPALLDEIHVVAGYSTSAERALSGADAGIYLYSTLSGWPKAAGALLRLLPRGLRRRLYACVAARRYRWFGRHTECILPTPEQGRKYVL
jgi:predicted DCC family thiol-disulfide oxidoreductase YuxK